MVNLKWPCEKMTKINELIKFLSIKLNVNEIKCEANLGGQQSKIVEKL